MGLDVRVDGRKLRLESEGGSLAFPDGIAPAPLSAPPIVHVIDDGVLVLSGGRQTHVVLVDPLQGVAAGSADESGEIAAPMHGRLIALFVEQGQAVEAGARLAVVEAMKMEHALNAPAAGRIDGLSVRVGDTVEQGRMLMRVLPEPNAPR